MKNISVLGSTGSLGTQTLEIVRANDDLKVVALAAGSNIEKLEEQILEFAPLLVCVFDEDAAKALDAKGLDVEVVSGMEGLIKAATISEAEMVVTAFVGMIGIKPTLEAIKAGKDIALANKETLVTAGHLVMPLAKENNVKILPVDSEHSAIFQSLQGNEMNKIDKILLTASGGPFRGWTVDQMKDIKVEDALKHPNWAMGQKITIDSSTMVNKGLEVIEAKWLFGVGLDDIQVIVQPQSLIHSMVQYEDGGIMAQLGTPDMKLPIQYALYYPERKFLAGDRVDFEAISKIDFETPDLDNFKGLRLAYEAAKRSDEKRNEDPFFGDSMPTVFNAANEKAVAMFLNREIGYLDIADIIEYCMEKHNVIDNPTVEQILEVESWVYETIEEKYK